jgi:hypothetical protein
MRLGANWRAESVETSMRARFEKSFVLVMDMGVEDLERRDIVLLSRPSDVEDVWDEPRKKYGVIGFHLSFGCESRFEVDRGRFF